MSKSTAFIALHPLYILQTATTDHHLKQERDESSDGEGAGSNGLDAGTAVKRRRDGPSGDAGGGRVAAGSGWELGDRHSRDGAGRDWDDWDGDGRLRDSRDRAGRDRDDWDGRRADGLGDGGGQDRGGRAGLGDDHCGDGSGAGGSGRRNRRRGWGGSLSGSWSRRSGGRVAWELDAELVGAGLGVESLDTAGSVWLCLFGDRSHVNIPRGSTFQHRDRRSPRGRDLVLSVHTLLGAMELHIHPSSQQSWPSSGL